jgi:diphthine methyl ester acylhydrolase
MISDITYTDLAQFDTKLTADVVEWRPNVSSDLNELACATYYLDKEKAQKSGCIYMLKYDEEEKCINQLDVTKFDDAGILDLRWISETQMLTIDSKNRLYLISYADVQNRLERIEQINLDVHEQNSVGLTLDSMKISNNLHNVLTSDDKGYLRLIRLNNERFHLANNFKAHDYEIWSVLFDKCNEHIVYTGADDCALNQWDLRIETSKPMARWNFFEGGVCSIVSCAHSIPSYSENNLLCGSYDERIYVIDKRNSKSFVKKSAKLNGGVWKIKPNSQDSLLLCACMHYGVLLLDWDSLQTKLYYGMHDLNTLAYGCDWRYKNASYLKETNNLIASCSFYNKSLRIWKLNTLDRK